MIVVGKGLALLELLQAVEGRMAAEGNHSTMVKFDSRNNADHTKQGAWFLAQILERGQICCRKAFPLWYVAAYLRNWVFEIDAKNF